MDQWRHTSRLFVSRNHLPLSSPAAGKSTLWKESHLSNSFTVKIIGLFLHGIVHPVTILLGLCLYLILIPYSFLPSIPVLGIALPLFSLIPFMIIMFYLIVCLLNARHCYKMSLSKILRWWILWLGLGLLAAGQTQPLPLSLMRWFLFEFSGSMVFMLVYLTPFQRKDFRVISIGLLMMIAGMAGYGIWIGMNGEPGWFGSLWEQKLKHDPDIIRVYEHFVPTSAFGNSSMRGSLIAMLLPGLMFNMVLFFSKLKCWNRIIMIGLVVFLGWALYRCDTTGAYLTVVMALVLFWIAGLGPKAKQWYRYSRKFIKPAALLLLLAVIIATLFTTDFDIRHRRLQWKIAFHILAGAPIWGVGTGNYPIYADRYASWYADLLPGGHHYNVADNYMLTFLVERGLAGILAAGIIGYCLIRRGLFCRALQIHDHFLETIIVLLWPVIMINALFWDIGNHLGFRILFFLSGALWIRLLRVSSTLSSPLPSDAP
ncbi:MAG: O-antigen ligase family protein [Candidatus Delongbacteria bacterium]|nr:O-antigen ligase family protein [Candidatus Delongbacteria bacterium]